ncbi:MAG: ribonuclease H-like domain-containing protein [Thermoplasmata archaeon]|nr:MAG: ribonuclease H-like domain-containing protein [Thermoplasmata archaeon]
MLINTFLHVPTIGEVKERRLWREGITDWHKALQKAVRDKLPSWVGPHFVSEIENSMDKLTEKNYRYFRGCLSHREYWRTFPEFQQSTVYLDIETTGLDRFSHDITVVGLYDGNSVKTFVKGQNMKELPGELKQYSSIVTFNGIMFDLPFISAKFRGLKIDQIQLDLRFILKRLGYSGGLKAIEKKLGITRAEETVGLSGYDAIRLWRQYERGVPEALDILIKYNTEDIVNLEYLMRFAYDELKRRTLEG